MYSALGDEPDLAFFVDDDDKKPAKRRRRKENTKVEKTEENITNVQNYKKKSVLNIIFQTPIQKNSESKHDGKLEESDDIAEEDPVDRTLRLERSLNRSNFHLKFATQKFRQLQNGETST